MTRIPFDGRPLPPVSNGPRAEVVGRIDLPNWCQFCPERATALLERRSDGKRIPVCDECRHLAHGSPLYWVKELWWQREIRSVRRKGVDNAGHEMGNCPPEKGE